MERLEKKRNGKRRREAGGGSGNAAGQSKVKRGQHKSASGKLYPELEFYEGRGRWKIKVE